MDATELYELTVSERRRLATLIENLTPQQWDADSLCSGWRVREVVAHLNSSETQTWPEFEAALADAGGDVELACDRTTRADTARFSDTELLDVYRRRIPSRWTPGPGEHRSALAHEVIHGLDITVALGLPGPSPRVVAAAMSGSSPQSLAFFGVDLGTTRLVAEDAELTVGAEDADAEVRLSAIELTLVATGRVALSAASPGVT